MAAKSPFKRLSDRQRKLVEEHIGYAKSIAMKSCGVPDLRDDCISVAMVKLVECAARYKKTKGKFKTFVFWQIRGEVGDFLLYQIRPSGYRTIKRNAPSTEPLLGDFGRADYGLARYERREAFEKIAAKITCPVSRVIVRLWILDGYSHEEIAQQRGCSVANVRYYWRKARDDVRAAFASESGQSKV